MSGALEMLGMTHSATPDALKHLMIARCTWLRRSLWLAVRIDEVVR